MDRKTARDLGAILRGARCAARFTQQQVGTACGYSASAISRIENGLMRVDDSTLMRVAAFLRIPPDRLTSITEPDQAAIDTVKRSLDAEEDAMHRRKLIAGTLAAGATAMMGSAPASASRPDDPAAAPDLEEALFQPSAGAPVPLTRLTQQAHTARADFTAVRYTHLARALPGLLGTATATRDAATGQARQTANTVLARANVLAAELALKQHSDAAWVAADRALTAARDSGNPVPIGEASRVLAITMRRSGRYEAAVRLLAREAADLDTTQTESAAVRTTLLLTAAYTAGTGKDRTAALELLEEAQDETERRGQAPLPHLFTVDATRTQVDLYRIGVLNALGTPDEAVATAATLDIDRMPTPERRARAWTDIARVWHALGDGRKTFAALRRIEQEAPQEVRRPALRALTADLLYAPGRLPGIRDFATQTGALSI